MAKISGLDFDFPASFGFSGSVSRPAAPMRKASGGAIKVRPGPERPMDSDVPIPPSKLGKPRGITGPLADIDEIHRGPGNRTTVRRGKSTEVFGNLDDAMHPDKAAGPTTRYTRGTDGSTTAEYAKGGKVKKWIQGAVPKAHKGMLHRALNVPEGKPIPAGKLAQAAKSKSPHMRRMAQFAKNVKR